MCEGTGRFPHRIKEGGSWGKHGFPHGSEPKASDSHTFLTSGLPSKPFGLISRKAIRIEKTMRSLNVEVT